MDINIKYKEQNKQEMLTSIIDDIKERTEHKFTRNNTAEWVKVIDAIYKEDSKQIESVEIRHPQANTIIQTIGRDMRIIYPSGGGQPGQSRTYTKSELSQYINLLQQIHDQLEG
jgi:hypothetical protein